MLLLCRSQRASAEVVCKEAFPEPQRRIRLKQHLLIYSEQEDTWMYRNISAFHGPTETCFICNVHLLILLQMNQAQHTHGIVHRLFLKGVCNSFTILPLCDMPTLRHFWKRQYWHLLRDFLWMRQWRSQWSYTNFNLIVRLKKPYEEKKKRKRELLQMLPLKTFALHCWSCSFILELVSGFWHISAGNMHFNV